MNLKPQVLPDTDTVTVPLSLASSFEEVLEHQVAVPLLTDASSAPEGGVPDASV